MEAICRQNRIHLTKDGSDWLTTALDPFHDYEKGLRGIPDHDTEPTALQTIHRKISITKPTTLVAGGKWDCHIVMFPILNTMGVDETDVTAVGKYDIGGAAYNIGTVTVSKGTAGDISFPHPLYSMGGTTEYLNVSVENSASNGASMKKLIAGGFEVHNDTNELYKSGSVTVYESPSSWVDYIDAVDNSYVSPRAAMIKQGRLPPALPEDAALFPSARTWSAAQGCYVPARINMANGTEFHPMDRSLYAFCAQDVSSLSTFRQGSFIEDPQASPYASGSSVMTGSGTRQAAITPVGAYFSGLHEDTVLTLDVRLIVEIAPTAANTAMLSMVSPTAMYDPVALRMYCNTIATLPVGVPVGMNAKGDFWKMALKAASGAAHIAAPLLTLTGHPVAGATAAAVGQTGDMVTGLLNQQKSARKKKPKPAVSNTHLKANNTFRK